MRSDLQTGARILKECGSFLIAGHVNPDGDALGCMCALGLALRSLYKHTVIVSPDGLPDIYRFLPGSDVIVSEVPAGRTFDAVVIVDSDNPERLGDAVSALAACSAILQIDHHPFVDWEPAVQIVDASAAACGEIVFSLFREMGVRIGADIAECLLTAIVTDTGSFKFTNVTPATLRIAADLIEAGATTHRIAQKVYETRSFAGTKLLGMALSTLMSAQNGRVTYAHVTREQMAASGASEAETEGIVNYIRSVRGARIGILFREGDGGIRVSLRAVDGIDISQVARLFGGGGHRVAAGCTVEQPLDRAVELVLDAVNKCMAY
jgi:bifunctional oligoribonuclease and PAP phosphatase NrnA